MEKNRAKVTLYPYNEKGNNFFILDHGNRQYVIEPPVFSLRNYSHLKDRELVIGFVGARGSGKTCGAAQTLILDYMLSGYKAWSNVDVAFNVVSNGQAATLRTTPLHKLDIKNLDSVFKKGVIFVSEVNVDMADARRSQTEANLKFSYVLQQIRHRQLNIIWDTQNEAWAENRLRWQTDVFIKCRDKSLIKEYQPLHLPKGHYSQWELYDMTGIVQGEPPNNKGSAIFLKNLDIWNRPWWDTYDTEYLHGMEEETETEEKTPGEVIAEKIANDDYIKTVLEEDGKIARDEIWAMFQIDNLKAKKAVANALLKHGIISHPPSMGSKTHFKYAANFTPARVE